MAPVWAACLLALMVATSPARAQEDEGQLSLRPGAPLADASGLGPLRRMSDPGRALLAEIQILDILPADSERPALDVNVKLVDLVEAGPSSPSVPPEIRAMVRSRADGSRYVLVGSRRAMSQPVLTLLVELRWPGGSYRRTYRVDTTTELASGRELMPARPLAANAPPAVTPAVPVAPAPIASAPIAAVAAPVAPVAPAAMPMSVAEPASVIEPARSIEPARAIEPTAAGPSSVATRIEPTPAEPAVAEPAASGPAQPAAVPVAARNERRQARAAPVAPAASRAASPVTDRLPQVAVDAGDGRYRVRSGDTLAGIGQRFQAQGISARQAMAAIYQGNAGAFRGDPNRLLAGAELTIPALAVMRDAPPLVLARAPAPASPPAGDRLSLAAPEPTSNDRRQQIGEESAIALGNALQEAESRISDLQSQVNQLNQLITAQSSRIEQMSSSGQANARMIRVDQREQRRSLPLRRDPEPEFHVDTTVVVGVLLAAAALMYLIVRLLTRWRSKPLHATP